MKACSHRLCIVLLPTFHLVLFLASCVLRNSFGRNVPWIMYGSLIALGSHVSLLSIWAGLTCRRWYDAVARGLASVVWCVVFYTAIEYDPDFWDTFLNFIVPVGIIVIGVQANFILGRVLVRKMRQPLDCQLHRNAGIQFSVLSVLLLTTTIGILLDLGRATRTLGESWHGPVTTVSVLTVEIAVSWMAVWAILGLGELRFRFPVAIGGSLVTGLLWNYAEPDLVSQPNFVVMPVMLLTSSSLLVMRNLGCRFVPCRPVQYRSPKPAVR